MMFQESFHIISKLKKNVWTNAFFFVGIFFLNKCPPINLKIDEDILLIHKKEKRLKVYEVIIYMCHVILFDFIFGLEELLTFNVLDFEGVLSQRLFIFM